MALKGIHFLLTYTCNFECDHCFLFCSPRAQGTFSLFQMKQVFREIKKVDTITSVSFEGGEPFLLYPLLLEAVKMGHQQGLHTSIETNTYWASSVDDALLWLKPLKDAGLDLVNVSDDDFHHGDMIKTPATFARVAADKIGLEHMSICIEKPKLAESVETSKGKPMYSGGAKLRGRAVEKLIEGLATFGSDGLNQCPYENLRDPGRVHLDAYGNVHLCQGLIMGNIWEKPLPDILKQYDPDTHPICGPLLKGGPAELVKRYDLSFEEGSVNECHLCTQACKSLINKFPEYLGPRQVYGL